jgi:NADH:ubiquinone oxidoreductase subunit H
MGWSEFALEENLVGFTEAFDFAAKKVLIFRLPEFTFSQRNVNLFRVHSQCRSDQHFQIGYRVMLLLALARIASRYIASVFRQAPNFTTLRPQDWNCPIVRHLPSP